MLTATNRPTPAAINSSRRPSISVSNRDQLVELRRLDHRSATSLCWKPRHTAGDVTGFLEELLNVPVTTRTLGTLERLVAAAPKTGYK